jgi:hypothetical protein
MLERGEAVILAAFEIFFCCDVEQIRLAREFSLCGSVFSRRTIVVIFVHRGIGLSPFRCRPCARNGPPVSVARRMSSYS